MGTYIIFSFIHILCFVSNEFEKYKKKRQKLVIKKKKTLILGFYHRIALRGLRFKPVPTYICMYAHVVHGIYIVYSQNRI